MSVSIILSMHKLFIQMSLSNLSHPWTDDSPSQEIKKPEELSIIDITKHITCRSTSPQKQHTKTHIMIHYIAQADNGLIV